MSEMEALSSKWPISKGVNMLRQWWGKFAIVVLLSWLASMSTAFGQKGSTGDRQDPVTTLRKRVDQTDARMSEFEKRLESLVSRANSLSAEQTALHDQVYGVGKKLDESGWKALDATTKLSALTWQLVAFFLGLMATLTYGGWQGYKLLRDKLEEELKESMANYETTLRHSTGAMAFGELCMGFWDQYSSIQTTEPAAEGARKRWLGAALEMSEFALEHVLKLEPIAYEKYEDLITNVRANFAYWLAVEPNPADPTEPNPRNAERARELAKTAYAVAAKYWKSDGAKYLHRWPDWIESYCWVLTRFGDASEKASAKEIIGALCEDVRIDPGWRKQTRSEYFGETK